MSNDLKLLVSGDTKELIIRNGEALKLKEPKAIVVTGDINTVKNFVEKRYLKQIPDGALTADTLNNPGAVNLQQFYKETAIVTFDKSGLSISLDVDPQNPYGPKITGAMVISDELKPWNINEVETFSREALVKLIKFNKRFFADPAVHDSVLKAFQNLSLTGNTELKAASDTRGNRNAAFDKKLNTEGIPNTFYLQMPIYKGMEPKKFLVEVCLDSAEHSIVFWLESVELKEIQDKTVDAIFDEQKNEFADFVIVNK